MAGYIVRELPPRTPSWGTRGTLAEASQKLALRLLRLVRLTGLTNVLCSNLLGTESNGPERQTDSFGCNSVSGLSGATERACSACMLMLHLICQLLSLS